MDAVTADLTIVTVVIFAAPGSQLQRFKLLILCVDEDSLDELQSRKTCFHAINGQGMSQCQSGREGKGAQEERRREREVVCANVCLYVLVRVCVCVCVLLEDERER